MADQLKSVGKTWRGYMEDMGNDPTRESATRGYPKLNSTDLTQSPEKPSILLQSGDQYASRHDPFVYFHSIIDSPDCNINVVNLNQLPNDLKSEAATPCVTGQPGGLVSADAFLQKWVPLILNSPAYQKGGLLVINFDEAVSMLPPTRPARVT